jgi:hypothetical protein
MNALEGSHNQEDSFGDRDSGLEAVPRGVPLTVFHVTLGSGDGFDAFLDWNAPVDQLFDALKHSIEDNLGVPHYRQWLYSSVDGSILALTTSSQLTEAIISFGADRANRSPNTGHSKDRPFSPMRDA